MTVQCTVPNLRPVACKMCKMWQILHDRAIKIVADFSILFDCHPFTLRNIANDKKRRYMKKILLERHENGEVSDSFVAGKSHSQ